MRVATDRPLTGGVASRPCAVGPVTPSLRGAVRGLALWLAAGALAALPQRASAQDLTPRAYVITPVGSNAVILSDIYNDGTLLFEGTVPITDATGKVNIPALSYYRSFGLFGRSANVSATLAYGDGSFRGTVFGTDPLVVDRSGLLDAVARLSVNLFGGRAMQFSEIKSWHQKLLVGAGLKVVAPTGQYDPTKLINLGANRWAFRPEVGLSRRWGHYLFDAYGGVWLFTENPDFFGRNAYVQGTHAQTQDAIYAMETHLSYDVRPRFWLSFDVNFWHGGRTSVDGVENPNTVQKSSRVGVTASFPITRRQALKVGYAQGAYVRFGGDYRILSVAWQYSWLSSPK